MSRNSEHRLEASALPLGDPGISSAIQVSAGCRVHSTACQNEEAGRRKNPGNCGIPWVFGRDKYPVRDSNPCYRIENPASWATRRTGPSVLVVRKKSSNLTSPFHPKHRHCKHRRKSPVDSILLRYRRFRGFLGKLGHRGFFIPRFIRGTPER